MSNHVTAQVSPEHLHEEMRTAEILFSGTLAEGVVSGGAVALAIIALAGGLPELLLSISAIALGASLFLEGAAITARFHNLLTEITNSRLHGRARWRYFRRVLGGYCRNCIGDFVSFRPISSILDSGSYYCDWWMCDIGGRS